MLSRFRTKLFDDAGSDVVGQVKSSLAAVIVYRCKQNAKFDWHEQIYTDRCAYTPTLSIVVETRYVELTSRTPPLPPALPPFHPPLAAPLLRVLYRACLGTFALSLGFGGLLRYHSETQNLGGSSCLYTCALRPSTVYGTKEDRSAPLLSHAVRIALLCGPP